uniref:SH3 domain-containing protein n=1 Tax=Strongyloides papillosus TaxID=174720 RepID=A0A0N5BSK8_STREA
MSNNSDIVLDKTTTEQPEKSSASHNVGLWIGISVVICIVLIVCGYVIYKRVKRKMALKNTKNASKKEKKRNKSKENLIIYNIFLENTISAKLKSFMNNDIQNSIKVEDLNSFKTKSDSKEEKNNKDSVEKINGNKEVDLNKNLLSMPSKSTYQFREKKTSNSKITENIDSIAEMKSQLENIKKVKPLCNNNRRNRSISSSSKNEKKVKENVKKQKKNLNNSETNKKENVKKNTDVNSLKSNSQNGGNNNEIFYSCSSDNIGKSPFTSSLHSSLALSDKDIEKLNKINVDTSYSSSTKSSSFRKDNIKNNDSTSYNTSNKNNVKKNNVKSNNHLNEITKKKDGGDVRKNRKNENFNAPKTNKVDETTYTVTEPEDIIEYNVSRDVLQKDNITKNINLVNNGTYVNQSFINLSSDCTQSQNLESNRVRRNVMPTIQSNVPKISNIYIYPQYNRKESFVRKGKDSQWTKRQITPSYFDYEEENCNIKKLQERFEIIDETSRTEDEYKGKD